ncbi:hypothetical protein [Calothrix sp. 336/3]|uniref:hypothetical protein n=1 Tax=Calothrix sp. 336/3 TaxID=1337936 RepID=UPI0004E37724|nr:hypothetical protein [Calothrix sp. 336/3]AKG24464.1 hypothetical protein IJ00_05370 [Calothrix sp. 336/3]
MERLEEQLSHLVKEACGFPPGSPQRQKRLTQVIRLTTNKLWRETTAYYQDALQQTWLYFCQNVCGAYDPTRGSVVTWLNTYLRWRLRDFQIKSPVMSGNISSGDGEEIDIISNQPAPPDIPPILEEIRTWAEQDSDGELRSTYVQGRPDVNCQMLILRRLPPEAAWKDLAEEFGLKVPTLSSFYQRKCMPFLRKFADKEGYL